MKKIILGLMLILSILSFSKNQSEIFLLYVEIELGNKDDYKHFEEFDIGSKKVIGEMEKKGYRLVNISTTEITKKIGYGSGNNGVLYTFIFEKKEAKNEKKTN